MPLNPVPPPPPRILPAVLLVELMSLGLLGKIRNVVTGKTFWGINSMGLQECLAGSQRSVRRCELGTNKDYRKYRNAITGKYSGKTKMERLLEKSVIGSLWLPETIQKSQIDPWPQYFWKVSRYTSHFYRDTFAKVCPLLADSSVCTPPICITIRLPFASRCFCRNIRVRGRWIQGHSQKMFDELFW